MLTDGRLLKMGKNCAAMNMAIDEAILKTQKERHNPTLRFYDWKSPAFSFGYFQNIASDVDVRSCREERIELVKRMTGGGTVVHGWDLTYSLILPRYSGENSISKMYQLIGSNLVNAFLNLGIPVSRYSPSNIQSGLSQNICLTNLAEHDVLCRGKKVAGVSVRRNRNGVLFQGYISLDMPPYPVLKRMSVDREGQKMIQENSSAINSEGRFVTRKILIQAISETFDIGISFHAGNITENEQILAEELATTKYETDSWNFD